ncbi:trypsin-like serine peptidase [Tunturiibacter gelidiferens]|uniref:trypsin-like serine peptidase n=1 Tax=Tunturiibacter gelidiferens TaxID=3069689 RepID=UPI003D9B2B35
MARKAKLDSHKASSPLTREQVFRLDNVMKHGTAPKALQSLKSSNSFTFVDAPGDLKLEKLIHKVSLKDGMAAYQIENKYGLVRGLPIQEYIRQRPGIQVESPTLPLPPPSPPFYAEWADRIYHPKLSPRMTRTMLRRKDGSRLYPHGYIWGSDARQAFFPSGYPWQCIGRLDVYTDPSSFIPSGIGTGTLVGPNTVITASHMVPWGANPAMIQFTPGYFNGVSVAGVGVTSYVEASSSYDTNSPPAPAFDFAVLKLQDRLGDSLGWLGSRSYDDNWNDLNVWTLVGYPGLIANAEQPSFQGGISFHDDDEDSNDSGDAMELETQDGDSSPGDSGGPYFAEWPDGPYVVGVDVGGRRSFR